MELRDCVGNALKKGDLVTVCFKTIPIFRVEAIEEGSGIATIKGTSPAIIRIICDMTLKQLPGRPFESLVRVLNPTSQEMIEAIADQIAKE